MVGIDKYELNKEVMTITIERFTAADITEATLLTQLTWGEEMALANEHLKNVLYEAMVRYYFRSSEFSYKIRRYAHENLYLDGKYSQR